MGKAVGKVRCWIIVRLNISGYQHSSNQISIRCCRAFHDKNFLSETKIKATKFYCLLTAWNMTFLKSICPAVILWIKHPFGARRQGQVGAEWCMAGGTAQSWLGQQRVAARWGGCYHKIILINQQMVEVTVGTEQSQKLTFIQLNASCSPSEELLLAGRLGYNW